MPERHAVRTRWWADEVAGRLAEIDARGQWRRIRDFDAAGPLGRLVDAGRDVVSFASNDYLGLTQHPAVVAAAHEALDRWGAGSGAARLVVGARPIHRELEDELAAWKGEEAALLFPTGFAANLGVLSVLGRPGVTVISDELNHASIIDGCRLARAEVAVYRHGDLDHLADHLADAGPAVVVTDTVFSMDGDVAPIDGIVALCADHDAILVVDEAHAALGPHPALDAVAHVRVGTLSKMLGSLGGFVAASAPVVDLLVNAARPFIFTTATTPADAAAALAALRIVRSEPGDRLVAHLRALVDILRPGHPSPIIPIVIGAEDDAVAAADLLLDRGMWVPAIRPPTVAPGTSRLRVALSAALDVDQVRGLRAALADVVPGA